MEQLEILEARLALAFTPQHTVHCATMELMSLENAGCEIEHHFSSGVYAKEVRIPAGRALFQHTHKFDHMSVLVSGKIILQTDKRRDMLNGPRVLNIPAGVSHEVHALTDAVWLCIHATDETDVDVIDASVVQEN